MAVEKPNSEDKQEKPGTGVSLEQSRAEYLAMLQPYASDPQRSSKASPDDAAKWHQAATKYLAALGDKSDDQYANLEMFTRYALLMVALAWLALCLKNPQCPSGQSKGQQQCMKAHLMAVRVYRELAAGLSQSSAKFLEVLTRVERMLEHGAYSALLAKGVEYPSSADVRKGANDAAVRSLLEQKMLARIFGPSKDPVEMRAVVGVTVRLYLHSLTPTISKIAVEHGLNPLPIHRVAGSWPEDRELEALLAALIAMLEVEVERDACQPKDTQLSGSDTDAFDAQGAQSAIDALYEKLSLGDKKTAFHHLQLSEEHYANGKWDDSISNSRKFLESVLAQVADKHATCVTGSGLAKSISERPAEVRDYLEREKLLETKEKDTLSKVYGLLSHTGGHPYVAQNDQARLLRHLALAFAQFVMSRLQGRLASNK